MKNNSIWKDTKIDLEYPKLDNDIDVDILIIGGGITGVSILNHLEKHNLDICLVEKNKIGMGVTSNTTGKLNYLQDNILLKMKDSSLYLKSQRDAISELKSMVRENNIECDLTKTKAYLFATKDKDIEKIKEVKKLLEDNKIKVLEEKPILVNSNYSIVVDDTYLFNPIKFIYGLLRKMPMNNIYENTKVIDIVKKEGYYLCKTESDNTIKAKRVILAMHYPYFLVPFLFPLKGKLEKSYLSASKHKIDPISAISYDTPTKSFRTYNDYFIYLSNSHDLSKKLDYQENFLDLRRELTKLNLNADYLWSNKDIMTNDYLPYIGSIKENLYLATGYNTWGMTNGILSGVIITDLIIKKDNPYIELFDPKRHNNLNVLSTIAASMRGYIKTMNNKDSSIQYIKKDGKEIAIYRDKDKKYMVYTRCPHFKCKLVFNEIEKTWDCPCHGSRFNLEGMAIEGPSNYNITYEEN